MIHLTSNSPVFAMEKAKKEEESNQVYSALPFLLFDHKMRNYLTTKCLMDPEDDCQHYF